VDGKKIKRIEKYFETDEVTFIEFGIIKSINT
jgi:hypothetical protein